jgi:hypothetical protein
LVLLFSSKFGANKKKWGSLLLTTVILLIIGAVFLSKSSMPPTSMAVSSNPESGKVQPIVTDSKKDITKEEFDQLESGMTYEIVTEILGMLGEVSSEIGFKGEKSHTITYHYKGKGFAGANAALTFQNNKLTNKMQVELK